MRNCLLINNINLFFFLLANPSRDHVFHITFPKEWKHTDISQFFSPFGEYCIDTSKNRNRHKICMSQMCTSSAITIFVYRRWLCFMVIGYVRIHRFIPTRSSWHRDAGFSQADYLQSTKIFKPSSLFTDRRFSRGP